MKILLLIDALAHGGAETHVFTLAQTLAARGHCVSVLSDGGALEPLLRSSGITCLHPPRPFGGRAWLWLWRNACYLCRLQKRLAYDVMHAHTRRTALLLRLLGRQPFLARVVSCHARFSPRFRRLSYWGEGTVAVSEDLARHLGCAFGVERRRVTVIANGIDLRRFCPAPKRRADEPLHIVFASRLDGDCSAAAYALMAILPRIKQRYTLRLCVAGGGDQYRALCAMAHKINAAAGEPLVLMTGALTDTAPLWQQADVFVGVSRAALEAAACGACVILAGNEGFGGLLTRENFEVMAQGNFCCRGAAPLQENVLEAALIEVLDKTPTERQEIAEGVRTLIAAHCHATVMAEATERVYAQVMSQNSPRRVLIAGYAGCGNLGDDAILRALTVQLRKQWPRVSIAATVADPMLSGADFPYVEPVRRSSPWALCRAMRRADAFFLGGGCLLQNCSAHGNRSLLYYLALLYLARLWRRPVCLVANGIGPLEGRMACRAVARALRHIDRISVRNEGSRRLAISLGVSEEKVQLEPDPVLLLSPGSVRDAERMIDAYLPSEAAGHRLIGICPRPSAAEAALTAAVARLWQEEGLYPVFFAFDRERDGPLCERMMAACGIGCRMPAENEALVGAVLGHGRVAAVIAQRLHALILSHVAGRGAVAVDYSAHDGKQAAFASTVGQPVLPVGSTCEAIVLAVRGIFVRQDE